MKTISCHALTTYIQRQLQAHYTAETSHNYSWWILEALTHTSRAQLATATAITWLPEQQQELDRWLTCLTTNAMPLAYLIGSVPFGNLIIDVRPPVLIPRVETEHWCMELIETLKTKVPRYPLTILDLGTGSGCIGLACAYELPQAHVIAVDKAPHALSLAQHNAQRNGITNISFIASDLFTALTPHSFDLILSNPPYLESAEWETLEPSVKTWEDPQALVADKCGLGLIKNILAQAPHYVRFNAHLAPHAIPQVVIEHGYRQGAAVVDLMQSAGYTDIGQQCDLEGNDRLVFGKVPDDFVKESTA